MQKSNRTVGFSLIELLVIIAIVGVLMALLVPALAGARENARTVECQSRLKQWGLGIAAYMLDERGFLPYENHFVKVGENEVRVDVYNLGSSKEKFYCWYGDNNGGDESVAKYLKTGDDSESIKICPTVALNDANSEESFRMNSKLADRDKNSSTKFKFKYRKHSTLTESSKTVVLFDADTGGSEKSHKGRWRDKNDEVSYRHNNSANILFADWSGETIGKKDLKKRSKGNDETIWQPTDMGEWDPNPSP